MAERTRLSRDGDPGGFKPICASPRRPDEIVHHWEWPAERGHAYTLDCYVACERSLEGLPPAARASAHVVALERHGMDALLDEQRRSWQGRWRAGDVQIEGDADAQRAVRWALYQLNSAVHPDDDRVSIGARGLSGLSYHGHAFWDTEIYMLPYFAFTWPEAARTLLMYRYRTLPAARAPGPHRKGTGGRSTRGSRR